MQSVMGQIQTKQTRSEYDDSYQGKRGRSGGECALTFIFFCLQSEANVCALTLPTGYSVAVGEFSGDQVEG